MALHVLICNPISNLIQVWLDYNSCVCVCGFSIQERFGKLEGLTFTWVGDGNNVLHDLMLGAAKLGEVLLLSLVIPLLLLLFLLLVPLLSMFSHMSTYHTLAPGHQPGTYDRACQTGGAAKANTHTRNCAQRRVPQNHEGAIEGAWPWCACVCSSRQHHP